MTFDERVVILQVVAGIGLYSIPVGALFDAFGEVLADDKEKED